MKCELLWYNEYKSQSRLNGVTKNAGGSKHLPMQNSILIVFYWETLYICGFAVASLLTKLDKKKDLSGSFFFCNESHLVEGKNTRSNRQHIINYTY